MNKRVYRIVVSIITALALALRLAWVHVAAREPTGLVDPARYLIYARAIADGKGMVEWTGNPTAYYPPGYPWFAGIVTWVSQPFTDSPWVAIALVQAVLGAATCALAALLAKRLAGQWAGIAAALVLAIYPNLVFHTGALLGETLFNFLFMAFLALFVGQAPIRIGRWPVLVGSGVLLGLAVMVRPISLAVLPVVALCWWMAGNNWRRTLSGTAVLTVGVLACILPWTVRNQLRMDTFVPLSTNTGENLCIGNSPDADGSFTLSDHCTFGDALSSPKVEAEVDQEKTRYAVEQILEHPGRQPWLVWRRVWFTWFRDGDHDGIGAVQSYYLDPWLKPEHRRQLINLADRTYWFVLVAGAAGLVRLAVKRRPEDIFVLGSTIMIAAVPLAFFGDSRFKVPVIPLLIVCGATLLGRFSTESADDGPQLEPSASPETTAQDR